MHRLDCVNPTSLLVLSLGLLAACAKSEYTPVCGDGVLDPGETCDNGPANSDVTPGACRSTCRPAHCGDYVIDPGETCDDGNLLDGDGCGPTCLLEARCGDGTLDANEQCDDGNTAPGDGCDAGCRHEFVCGDGLCDTVRNETCVLCPHDCCPCDDGSCEAGKGETCGGCHEDCCPDCGDGTLDPVEQCDDGNVLDGDGCARDCKDEDGSATCGNLIWEAGEGCDDGNTDGGDGCSETCQVDWICGDGLCEDTRGETCQRCGEDCCPDCGNGVLEAGEECDGAETGGLTCASQCYDGGSLLCTSWCALDWSGCMGAPVTCGDGVVECGEECDGANLDGQTCGSLGYDGGTLACGGGCTFDYALCGPKLAALEESFETCPPAGWSLTGTWQCGTPTVVGPSSARSGLSCLGTIINGNYANSLAWTGNTATSPEFSLAPFVAPKASFFLWYDTESSGLDGANLKISTDGGTTYTVVSTVVPAYAGTVQSQAAWGGRQSALGWQYVIADLSAYAGQPTVRLQLGFASDSSVVYAGAYIDELTVAEDGRLPMYLSPAKLPRAEIGVAYGVTFTRQGGPAASVTWSLPTAPAWLSIDPATGALSGTPAAGDEGTFPVTIRAEDPVLPSNAAEVTYALRVGMVQIYSSGFDGACPNGWTLTSEWQCGTPSSVGPAAAHSGTQCLGTLMSANYSNSLTWAGTNATSPAINLAGTVAPEARFWMYVYTESCCDGANLKVSTDGTSYAIVTGVTPAYTGTVDSQACWGGNLSASGWQLVTADLSAYAGQTIYLRFGFRSDSSVVNPGVYIDDLMVID